MTRFALFLAAVVMVVMARLPATLAVPVANPVCVPKFELPKDLCDARIETCEATDQLMTWVGQGSRDKSGKLVGDGGCQCAFYCGFKQKRVCENSRFSKDEVKGIKAVVPFMLDYVKVGQKRCQWIPKQGCVVKRSLYRKVPSVFQYISSYTGTSCAPLLVA